jgi:hypothetical protein
MLNLVLAFAAGAVVVVAVPRVATIVSIVVGVVKAIYAEVITLIEDIRG